MTYAQGALSDDVAARSLGGSVELGYKYDVGPGFYLNPLAQLAYVAGNIDDGSLGGAPISFADGDSLRGRAGLRAGYLGAVAGAMVEPYVEAISCMNLPAAIAVSPMAIGAPAMGWTAGDWSAAGFR